MGKNNLKSFFIKRVILPFADLLMGTCVYEKFRQIERMSKYSKEDILKWQNDALSKLIFHAYQNTKYYNSLFHRLNLQPGDIKTIDDLKKLPILTKQDIRENYNDLVPSNLHKVKFKKSATGGSTGDPLKFLLDLHSWSYTTANNIYYWEKVDYRYGDKYVALGSTSLFVNKKASIVHRIYYMMKNKIGLNGINLSDEKCEEYLMFIKKHRIKYVYGYASSIYLLAAYAIQKNIATKINAVFSTSEMLTDLYRETISMAFKCPIMDCYGARDGGIMAFSTTPGAYEVGYNCLVRIEDPDKKGLGSALLTDLLNYAMPLINYRIGDELILLDGTVEKYNGQLLNSILGRSSEIIKLENGKNITGSGFTILFKDLPVEYYCIEKTGPNKILCSIKKMKEYNKNHEDLIISTFKKQIGENSDFEICYTETVRVSKSGKRLFFIP